MEKMIEGNESENEKRCMEVTQEDHEKLLDRTETLDLMNEHK